VLIAAGSPLTPEPSWVRYDDVAGIGCEGFDWHRGRQSEFDVTNTGTATVFFDDRTGAFADETLVGGQIMLQLHNPVLGTWEPVFRGHIDDIHSEPSPGAPSLTNSQLECVGIFDYLAGVRMVVGEFGDLTPVGMSGVVFYEDGPVDERIVSILTDAGIDTDMYVVFSGNVDVNETLYDPDDNALSAIRDASDAEFPSGVANAYEDRFGRIVWHGRFAKFDPDGVSGDAGDSAWDFQRWEAGTRGSVGTTRSQVREFQYNRPRSRIINSYVAWPALNQNGQEFPQSSVLGLVRTDTGSISSYGYRGSEAGSLIIKKHKTNGNTGADECGLFGDFYIANYAEPRKNVERITFRTLRPDDPRAAANWALMCRIDVSDAVDLYISEAGLDGEEFFVEGVSGTCRNGAAGWDIVTVTPNLSPAAYYTDNVFEA